MGPEVPCVPLQAILLLVPAFLLIGWGHSLPVLGLGLLLYSFGEWACQGQGARRGLVATDPSRSQALSPLGDGASLMSPISCRCRGALSVLRGRRLW